MFGYFRLNDPYRLVLIFAMLLAMRLPVMFSDSALTVEELNYMVVGEKMSEGSGLYSELWDNIAPLSALVYATIDFLFGRSQIAYQVIALFLVFFQVFLFNRMFIGNKAFTTNTYVPGLLYALFMSMFFDFATLTPMLMAITFLLMALQNIFQHIEFRAKRDEMILNIGIYLGLSYLFYLPMALYGIATIFIFILLTGTVTRRYLLMIFGFALPFVLSGIVFLIQGRLQDFMYCFASGIYHGDHKAYLPVTAVLGLFIIPLFYFVTSLVRVFSGARLTNYQSRLTRAMFIWMLFSFVTLLISDLSRPNSYIVLIPVMAFFTCHYYLLIKRRFIAEVIFTFLLIALVTVNFGMFYKWFDATKFIDLSEYAMTTNSEEHKKRVLVLGDDLRPYLNAGSATPFLNWKLARPVFTETDYYDNITLVYKGISSDPPDVIIDENDVMSEFFNRMPQLKSKYQKNGNRYLKISN